MGKLIHGHAQGHVRDAALAAFEAWASWDGEGPEPTVEYEIHYEPHEIPISRMCKLVWNCTDIVPGLVFDLLTRDMGLEIKRQTYAACARAIIADIERRAVQAAA
jgi:hypothetical protein